MRPDRCASEAAGPSGLRGPSRARNAAPTTTVGSTNGTSASAREQPPAGKVEAREDVRAGQRRRQVSSVESDRQPEREPGDVERLRAAPAPASGAARSSTPSGRGRATRIVATGQTKKSAQEQPAAAPPSSERPPRARSAQDDVGPLARSSARGSRRSVAGSSVSGLPARAPRTRRTPRAARVVGSAGKTNMLSGMSAWNSAESMKSMNVARQRRAAWRPRSTPANSTWRKQPSVITAGRRLGRLRVGEVRPRPPGSSRTTRRAAGRPRPAPPENVAVVRLLPAGRDAHVVGAQVAPVVLPGVVARLAEAGDGRQQEGQAGRGGAPGSRPRACSGRPGSVRSLERRAAAAGRRRERRLVVVDADVAVVDRRDPLAVRRAASVGRHGVERRRRDTARRCPRRARATGRCCRRRRARRPAGCPWSGWPG